MHLSPQQDEALVKIDAWLKTRDPIFTLGGYAGTGKTTLAQVIREHSSKPVIFAAYTGKAASVLREKGIRDATTIHNILYNPTQKSDRYLRLLEQELLQPDQDELSLHKLKKKIEFEKKKLLEPVFDTKEGVNFKNSLVVVDEYSMLDEKIIDDLLSVSDKILALGDPFQLPPVHGESPLRPDFFLTEVHRQALDSPILRAATEVRNGGRLVFAEEPGFKYVPQYQATQEDYLNADQIIVARNNTRRVFNKRVRKLNGFSKQLPQKGDRLICLKNDHKRGIYNGIIGDCMADTVEVNEDSALINYCGQTFQSFRGHFDGRIAGQEHQSLSMFDYAYAITCHKSQGSEFDNVTVYREPTRNRRDEDRWLYTAITRAKENLTIVEADAA